MLFAAAGLLKTAKFPPGNVQESAPDATGVFSGLSPRAGHAEGGGAR